MLFKDNPFLAKENSYVHPIQSPRIMNNVSRVFGSKTYRVTYFRTSILN